MIVMLVAGLLAQDPVVLQPSSNWLVDPIERTCEAGRSFGATGPDATLLSMRRLPGEKTMMTLRADGLPRPGSVTGLLRDDATGATTQAGAAQIGSKGKTRGLILYQVDSAFLAALSPGSTVTFLVNGKPVATIRPTGMAAALKALDTCGNERLRGWGVDVEARMALRQLPELINGFDIADKTPIPSTAMHARSSGQATLRFTVGADGRVRDCTIVDPSGDAKWDRNSCRTLETQARYRPAIGADGKPADATLVTTFAYSVDTAF